MPFTPAHALAVAPIAAGSRGQLPFSALVIGSMIPDLPLFVAAAPDYATTHSLSGLFTACLPLGVAAWVLFQTVMKRPLIALLPAVARRRCAVVAGPSCGVSVRVLVGVALGVVIGAATHIVWDAFSHHGRWGTRLVPWLNSTVTVAGHALPGYKAVQFGSAAVSLPLLGMLAIVWLVRQPTAPLDALPSVPRALRLAFVLTSLGLLTVLTQPVWGGSRFPIDWRVGRAIEDSGLPLMIAVLAYCLAASALAARSGGFVRTTRSGAGTSVERPSRSEGP